MKIVGPEKYKLRFDASKFAVVCPQGTSRFSGLANSRAPKLYVISAEGKLVYIGITKQRMQSRLAYGWRADGATGYYGYRWRRHLSEADLHIWAHEDAREGALLDIETVEAEVVFLIRQRGQWPSHQTEIHFHPSTEAHRDAALRIFSHFQSPRII